MYSLKYLKPREAGNYAVLCKTCQSRIKQKTVLAPILFTPIVVHVLSNVKLQ